MKPSKFEIGNMLETLEARITPSSINFNGGIVKAAGDDSSFIRDFEDGDALSPADFGAPEIVSGSELRFKDADGDYISVKFSEDILTVDNWQNAFSFEEAGSGTSSRASISPSCP